MNRATFGTLAIAAVLVGAVILNRRSPAPPAVSPPRYPEFPELQTDLDLYAIANGHYRLESRLPNGTTGGTEYYSPNSMWEYPHQFIAAYQANGLVPLRFWRVE